MYNCWLSPQGCVYHCEIHQKEAEKIVYDLGLKREFDKSFKAKKCFCEETFLEQKGWIKYCIHLEFDIPIGWVIPDFANLTQAQIDKIYELTGEIIVDNNLLGPCTFLSLCTVIFLIKKISTNVETV